MPCRPMGRAAVMAAVVLHGILTVLLAGNGLSRERTDESDQRYRFAPYRRFRKFAACYRCNDVII